MPSVPIYFFLHWKISNKDKSIRYHDVIISSNPVFRFWKVNIANFRLHSQSWNFNKINATYFIIKTSQVVQLHKYLTIFLDYRINSSTHSNGSFPISAYKVSILSLVCFFNLFLPLNTSLRLNLMIFGGSNIYLQDLFIFKNYIGIGK